MADPQLPKSLAFVPELTIFSVHSNNSGLDLSNSFLVLAKKGNNEVINENRLAWHYSTGRKMEYCIATEFLKSDDGDVKVFKTKLSDKKSRNSLTQKINSESTYSIGSMLRDEFEHLLSRDWWTHEELKNLYVEYFNYLRKKSGYSESNENFFTYHLIQLIYFLEIFAD